MIENGPGSSYDVDISLVVVISICYCIASLMLHKFREDYGYAPPIHESCIASLLGLIIGVISRFLLQSSTIKFNQDLFFYLILPPIVFSAGYGLKKKKFFRFIHFITCFGIIGTVINFTIISTSTYYFPYFFPSAGVNLTWIESMLLASVVSANDEISALSLIKINTYPRLGGLIFGEGVINDALSIVLFKTLYSIYFNTSDSAERDHTSLTSISYCVLSQLFNSCFIGLVCGLINARLLKVYSFSRKHPVHQTSLVLLTGYLAYCIAEASGTSGILTLFVCAVTLSHYSWHSLSKSAQLSTKIMFVSLSDLAEGISFAYVGLSLWNYSSGDFSLTFSCYLLLIIIASRFFTIVTICRFTNYMFGDTINDKSTSIGGYRPIGSDLGNDVGSIKKVRNSDNIIPFNEQIAFTLGGVVRGCLCWAQILQLHDSLPILMTATLFVIFVSTNGCGILLPIVIPRLLGEENDKNDKFYNNSSSSNNNNNNSNNNSSSNSNSKKAQGDLSKVLSYQSPHNNADNIDDSTYSMHVDHSEDGDSRNLDEDEYDDDDVYSDAESVMDEDTDEQLMNDFAHGDGNNLELFQRDFIHNSSVLSEMNSSSDRDTLFDLNKYDTSAGTSGALGRAQNLDIKNSASKTKLRSTNKSDKKRKQSSQSANTGSRSYSHLFVCWVRIDELFLKPLFGGSKTGQTKSKLIELSNNVDVISLLSPTKKVVIRGQYN